MITRFKSKKIILENDIYDGFVYVREGKIIAVTDTDLDFDNEIDLGENYLAPGFVDVHVHGAAGVGFGECESSQISNAVEYHLKHGTTTIVPTFTSETFDNTVLALERFKEFFKDGYDVKCNVAGVHLEGPYFSVNQCGAQNTDHITPPVKNQYMYILENYGDIISRWSYAPERDTDCEFCRTVTDRGIIASAGHTDATYDDMQNAVKAGLGCITHLYSCTSTVTRKNGYRIPGVLEFAFAGDITAEIITDGSHLPQELIKMIYKIKGREQLMLVTDATSVCGVDVKEGVLGGVPFIVEDGVCKLKDRSAFAGSIATTDRLVRTCVGAGIPIVDCVYMASSTPAKHLKLNKGFIKDGYDADFVVFDDGIDIKSVFIGGERV